MIFNNNLKYLTEGFYLRRIEIYGEKNECFANHVGWASYNNQMQGFEVATNLDSISWSSINSVLDIGCGYGELVAYLREKKGFQGFYTGVDIVSRFVETAIQIYGHDTRNNFICGDILSCGSSLGFYDVVISMGTLSVNYDYPASYGETTRQFTENLIELICSLADKSVVLYFPNEENTVPIQRALAADMSFYRSDYIHSMLLKSSKKRCPKITIESYPHPEDVKTIAKTYYV